MLSPRIVSFVNFPKLELFVRCMYSSNKSRMVRCFTFVEPNMKHLYDTKKLKR